MTRRLWKSGASAPRKSTLKDSGFSPCGSQGLQAAASTEGHNAAPEGPLFHGHARATTKVLVILSLAFFWVNLASAQVTFERIVNSGKEPQNWLTYSGDYAGRRFSPLDQVNTSNARALAAKWVYQTGATGKIETTPLVVDGLLYATAQYAPAFALDARPRRPIWIYHHQVPV